MKKSVWRFSLRAFLTAIMLLGVIIALLTNYPLLLFVSLFLAIPILFGKLITYLVAHRPVSARVLLMVTGLTVFSFIAYLVVILSQSNELPDGPGLFALVMLSTLGFGCFVAAWSISGKAE